MKTGSLRAFILGAGVMGLLIALAAPIMLLTHHQELPLERRFGGAAVSLVVRLNAGDAKNPYGALPQATEPGRAAYTGSCAICHGAKGDGRGLLGQGTFPDAIDLTADEAKARTDAELFWVIKNGLAFTAMPAFRRDYVDLDIWAMVSYIRALQVGKPAPAEVPAPSRTQLAFADATGGAVRRGAAHYFALGCAGCHGAVGDAAGELALTGGVGSLTVRSGGRGMPGYGFDRLTDGELADLAAYVSTFTAGVSPSAP